MSWYYPNYNTSWRNYNYYPDNYDNKYGNISNNKDNNNDPTNYHDKNKNIDKFNRGNDNKYYYSQNDTGGIINFGNNCYLNSGLQILASSELFVNELNKYSNDKFKLLYLLKEAVYKILNKELYDPRNFLNYFREISRDFYSQSCSQNFIRTLLKSLDKQILDPNSKECIYDNIQYNPQNQPNENNKFFEFVKSNNFFKESKLLTIFSGMTKSHSQGRCNRCNNNIDEFSFSYFIDQNLYLDNIKYKCDFKRVLNENYVNFNNLILNCPFCKQEITIKEETKIIKLPEILIFTLERYQGATNNVEIMPNETLDMNPYIDKSLKSTNAFFELFAINIRLGNTKNYGHEICQVKRKGEWYEINDTIVKKINSISFFDSSYGLFYKKK